MVFVWRVKSAHMFLVSSLFGCVSAAFLAAEFIGTAAASTECFCSSGGVSSDTYTPVTAWGPLLSAPQVCSGVNSAVATGDWGYIHRNQCCDGCICICTYTGTAGHVVYMHWVNTCVVWSLDTLMLTYACSHTPAVAVMLVAHHHGLILKTQFDLRRV